MAGVYHTKFTTIMNDEELHRLLRQHPVNLQLPSCFEREVWFRVESGQTRSLPCLLRELSLRFLASLSRPVPALVTLISFSIVGLGLGWEEHHSDMAERAAHAYQRSVNPLFRPMPEDKR